MLHLSTSTKDLTNSTKIRRIGLRERNKLTAILSISHCWKDLAAVIRNPDDSEEFLYTSQDIDILDLEPSPAAAFLENWSTTGRVQPTLRDLLGFLREAHLLRAVHFVQHELLKDEEEVTEELETVLHLGTQQDQAASNLDTIVDQLQNIDISDLTLFPYDELSKATNDFCNLRLGEGGCKIGEGSYGSVYRATILGVAVAVKQLKEAIDKQFFTELSILVRCKHENLLSLLGCSVNGPKCCLVYEYMPNGSLQDRLACNCIFMQGNTPPLSSVTRLQIAYGSALGINYLHTFGDTPMVHRDIKSANILLDKNFVPKIGDFGLVRIGSSGGSSTMAVTENVYGTSVYMANEAFFGDVSVKLDTFSFGVVLLELLTGLPPHDTAREDRDLITHMESCDDILEMLDSKVIWNSEKAIDLYNISQLCIIRSKKKRPTIFEILPDLGKCCLELPEVEQWV